MDKFVPLRYVQCNVCRGKKGPLDQPGLYYITNATGQKKVVECQCHKEWVVKNRTLLDAYACNINSSEFSQRYSLDSYIGTKSSETLNKIRKYLNGYQQKILRSYVMYMHGVSCTQKTTVAQYIGLSIFRLGYTAYYIRMKEFAEKVCMPNFSASEEITQAREEFLKKMETTDCLIIDDAFDKNVSPVYSTGSQSPYIEGFLRDRIEGQNRGVLFVSKVPVDMIQKNGYSESLQSFVSKSISKFRADLPLYDVIDENNMAIDFNVDSIFGGKDS